MAPLRLRIGRTLLGLATAGMCAVPLVAHHSFAMFDKTQTRVLSGTVKDFQRVNPHGYLDVVVETKSGRTQTWSVELQGALALGKVGVQADTFKPGDKVLLTINPLRNGTTGGAFVSAVLPDGRTVGAKPD